MLQIYSVVLITISLCRTVVQSMHCVLSVFKNFIEMIFELSSYITDTEIVYVRKPI